MFLEGPRGIVRRARGDSGQILILFVGVFTIMAIAAAISIDFGLWLSERRGAQRDSDLVALAGAYELLDDDVTFGDVDDATTTSALQNDLDPLDDLHNLAVKSLAFPDGYEEDGDYCHDAEDDGGRLNAVVLDVDHESRALFASIFGLVAPEIGAHACARAGSLISTSGLRPWAIPMYTSECFDRTDNGDGEWGEGDEYVPQFGQDCVIRAESPSSQVHSIRLGDDEGDPCRVTGGGGSAYRENIVEGAEAICKIGDLVRAEPGLTTGPTFAALAELLSTEGACDDKNGDGDGIDQFAESFEPTSGVPGPDETFVARDCKTPRSIHLVITTKFDGQGQDDLPVEGFAAYYLQQCEEVDGDGNVLGVYEDCDIPSGSQANIQIRGFFMNILELEGDIGNFDPFGTHVIRLVE